jgi:hypothetical protein
MAEDDHPKSIVCPDPTIGQGLMEVKEALIGIKGHQDEMHGDIREIKGEAKRTNGRLDTLEEERTKQQGAAEERKIWEEREAKRVEDKIDSGNRKIGWVIGVGGLIIAGGALGQALLG